MKIELARETRLEIAPIQEVKAILDARLETTSPESVADYIALSVQNLDDRLTKIKDAENQIKALKVEIVNQISTIKHGSAEWLSSAGIDKLNGLYISSISISAPKPKEELKIVNEDALINAGYFKTTLDKTAVKNAIKDGVEIEGATIEITHEPEGLRINKRTKKLEVAS